jgi:hypothetical protein
MKQWIVGSPPLRPLSETPSSAGITSSSRFADRTASLSSGIGTLVIAQGVHHGRCCVFQLEPIEIDEPALQPQLQTERRVNGRLSVTDAIVQDDVECLQ